MSGRLFTLAAGADTVPIATKDGKDGFTFVMNAPNRTNSYGFRVDSSGIKTEDFMKNPICLWMHQRGDQRLPIGHWSELTIDADGNLVGTLYLDPNEQTIKEKVESGTLRACSIGIEITNYVIVNEVVVITECTLVECSLVDIPSNPAAVKKLVCNLNSSNQPNTNTTMKTVVTKLGLPDTATEAQTLAKVTALIDENAQLRNELQDVKERAIKKLVADAVSDGRIQEADSSAWTNLAAANFDSAAQALAALPARSKKATSLTAQLGDKQKAMTSTDVDSMSQSEKQVLFMTMWKAGELTALREEDPKRYQVLYDAYYQKYK